MTCRLTDEIEEAAADHHMTLSLSSGTICSTMCVYDILLGLC